MVRATPVSESEYNLNLLVSVESRSHMFVFGRQATRDTCLNSRNSQQGFELPDALHLQDVNHSLPELGREKRIR